MFKKTRITLRGRSELLEVNAWQLGDWAYHQTWLFDDVASKSYTVTHVPSGMRTENFLSYKVAKKLTQMFAESMPIWRPSEKMIMDCIKRNRRPVKFRRKGEEILTFFHKGGRQ